MIKVKDYPNLYRDEKTGAIINNDFAGYDQYLKSLHLRKVQKREIDQIKDDINEIKEANIYIIAVPTPIDENNKPDLKILFNATKDVGSVLNKNDIVIFESTVYPGCTEEDCVPILEQESGLKYNIDFNCGYSPERINPGDKNRTLTKIIKITSHQYFFA